ncbi:hypothetical protein [Bosea sp. PAMC 26642]|uniref:hypothetical protein n=1 Tax=Bosea sp. (strain PAMC 26642) TaxID=1792307 RepID=UPI000B2B528A|nr:hypothetical protein [Bosea sp. PAMC 26642]
MMVAGFVGTPLLDAAAQTETKRLALPKGKAGCFRRVYDAAHLARNPDQTVIRIELSRGPTELKREAIDGPEAPQIGLRLSTRTRTGAGAGPEALDCHSRDADEGSNGKTILQCGSTCGRGSLDVVIESADRVTLRIGGTVKGRFITDAVGLGRRCDSDSDVVWLGDAGGDRVFVLERAPVEECR